MTLFPYTTLFRSYRVYIRVHNYPINFWHHLYFRLLTSGFGELLYADDANLRGPDRANLRLTIRCFDPDQIPQLMVINSENKWTKCWITILGWEVDDESPLPGSYGGPKSGGTMLPADPLAQSLRFQPEADREVRQGLIGTHCTIRGLANSGQPRIQSPEEGNWRSHFGCMSISDTLCPYSMGEHSKSTICLGQSLDTGVRLQADRQTMTAMSYAAHAHQKDSGSKAGTNIWPTVCPPRTIAKNKTTTYKCIQRNPQPIQTPIIKHQPSHCKEYPFPTSFQKSVLKACPDKLVNSGTFLNTTKTRPGPSLPSQTNKIDLKNNSLPSILGPHPLSLLYTPAVNPSPPSQTKYKILQKKNKQILPKIQNLKSHHGCLG